MPNYRRANIKGGTYFFTVNTHRRQPFFTHESARRALQTGIEQVKQQYPFTIEAWVLMPDHLHYIWTMPENDADFSIRWSKIKRYVSLECKALIDLNLLTNTQRKNNELGFWQRRFWEHQIRDEEDYKRHIDYIHWNPVKHGYVTAAYDWPFSTFHHFVQKGVYSLDWGSKAYNEDGQFGE